MTTFAAFIAEFEQSKHQYPLVREYLQRDLSTAWERFAPAIEAVLAGGAVAMELMKRVRANVDLAPWEARFGPLTLSGEGRTSAQ